jgi:hypothetical protein
MNLPEPVRYSPRSHATGDRRRPGRGIRTGERGGSPGMPDSGAWAIDHEGPVADARLRLASANAPREAVRRTRLRLARRPARWPARRAVPGPRGLPARGPLPTRNPVAPAATTTPEPFPTYPQGHDGKASPGHGRDALSTRTRQPAPRQGDPHDPPVRSRGQSTDRRPWRSWCSGHVRGLWLSPGRDRRRLVPLQPARRTGRPRLSRGLRRRRA